MKVVAMCRALPGIGREETTYDTTEVRAALLLGARLQYTSFLGMEWSDASAYMSDHIRDYPWLLFRAVIDD